MSLFRLVYASTSLLSDEPDLAREQIEQILLVSCPRADGTAVNRMEKRMTDRNFRKALI